MGTLDVALILLREAHARRGSRGWRGSTPTTTLARRCGQKLVGGGGALVAQLLHQSLQREIPVWLETRGRRARGRGRTASPASSPSTDGKRVRDQGDAARSTWARAASPATRSCAQATSAIRSPRKWTSAAGRRSRRRPQPRTVGRRGDGADGRGVVGPVELPPARRPGDLPRLRALEARLADRRPVGRALLQRVDRLRPRGPDDVRAQRARCRRSRPT